MKQCFDMVDISLDAELRAMQDIAAILHQLDQPARARVLHWIAQRFQADASAALVAQAQPSHGTRLSDESDDDSLSVATLGDLFEAHWSPASAPSDQPGTEDASVIAAEDLSDFLDRADADNAPRSRPSIKPDTGPGWPILPKPILT